MAAWVEATTREMGQSLINPDKPSVSVPGDTEKPVLNPKPHFTAKPFSLQRNATVRPIQAPKTNFSRQLHRASSSETLLNTTDTQAGGLETSDSNGTVNGSDQSAAPKPVPLCPKPDLQAKPKPEPTKSPDTTGSNDQTGPNSKLEVTAEDMKNVQSRSRAKSLGSRDQKILDQKEQGAAGDTDADVKVPSRCWPARNRLSTDLTSKFQSPSQPDTVGRDAESSKTEKEEPPLSPSAVSESKSPVENEETGCSIKRRISLLFDRSAASQRRDTFNKRDITPAEISIDIKQRIQNLSLDTRLPSTGDPKSPPYEKTNERSSERETEKVPVDKPPNTPEIKNSAASVENAEEVEEDKENYVTLPVHQRVRMSIDAEKKQKEEEEKQRKDEQLEKERQQQQERTRLLEEERKAKEIERQQEEERKQEEEKQRQMEERRKQEEEWKRKIEEESKEEERRRQAEKERERQQEQERLERERQIEEEKRRTEEEKERQREEERMRQEKLKKEREMEEERRRIQEMERQKEEEKLRKEREMESIRKEKEMEKERLKEEERLRQEREIERIKKEKEMEEERLKEEERLRQEREKERLKKEKQMEQERRRIQEMERQKEEERLRQEREKEEQLKKEREMEEERQRVQEMERQKEEERLRKEREMERIRKEKEMEEERRRLQEMEKQKEEERLRKEREMERIRKEKEMEEERRRLQEMERQKEEERLRKERELERIKKDREIEERKRMEEERLRQERENDRLKKEMEMERCKSAEIVREEVPTSFDLISFDACEAPQTLVSPRLNEVLYDDFSVKPRRWGTGAGRSSTPSPPREPERSLQPEPVSKDPGSQEPCGERGNVEELMGFEPEASSPQNQSKPEDLLVPETESDEGQLKDCEPEEDAVVEQDTENLIRETNAQSENQDDVDGLGTESRIGQALQRLTRVKRRNTSTDSDTPDVPDEEESKALPVLESAAPLLDSSVLRSRVDLAKKRSIKRSRPTRAVRQRGALPALTEGTNPDWRFCDSTDAKDQCFNEADSESEEEPSRDAVFSPAPCKPKRVPMFPGMNPLALMAQLKRRSGVVEAESPTEAQTPPCVPARSPRTPTMTLGPRVLPPVDAKDSASGSSPSWLLELKSKKRMNQPDSEA